MCSGKLRKSKKKTFIVVDRITQKKLVCTCNLGIDMTVLYISSLLVISTVIFCSEQLRVSPLFGFCSSNIQIHQYNQALSLIPVPETDKSWKLTLYRLDGLVWSSVKFCIKTSHKGGKNIQTHVRRYFYCGCWPRILGKNAAVLPACLVWDVLPHPISLSLVIMINEISFCMQLDHLNTRPHAKFHLISSHARLVPFECLMAVICSWRSNMKNWIMPGEGTEKSLFQQFENFSVTCPK